MAGAPQPSEHTDPQQAIPGAAAGQHGLSPNTLGPCPRLVVFLG